MRQARPPGLAKRASVARTYSRFLTAIALAIAIEHFPGALVGPCMRVARAQNFPTDPITGAPAGISSNGLGMSGNTSLGPGPYIPSNYGPTGPTFPTTPSRPSSWPGGRDDPGSPYTPPPRSGPPTAPNGAIAPGAAPLQGANRPAQQPIVATSFARKKSPADPPWDPAEIVAYVGNECIQANEVLPFVNQRIALFLSKAPEGFDQLPPAEKEDQINQGRKAIMKQAIEETIKIKLLLSEVRRKIPADMWNKHEEQVRKYFNANEIKPMMAQYKASSIIDLDKKLREQGSSLESNRTSYIERQMALSWLAQQIKDEVQEVTHEQMLHYYREHQSEWETPARARWEQLTVKFQNYDSKAAAHDALARWGNEVFRGAPFASVAKAHSQDPLAEEGGAHDWVGQGSLRSTVLDEALFKLPVGTLSQIIEDDDCYYIIRVVERADAKRTPFNEVQPEIKKILQNGDKDQQRNTYLAKLRERVPVMTIFDEDFVARTSQPNDTKLR
jgi:parvulin-like peptidyl-prolyl isomerase